MVSAGTNQARIASWPTRFKRPGMMTKRAKFGFRGSIIAVPPAGGVARVGMPIAWALIGYGYRNWQAGMWFALLVLGFAAWGMFSRETGWTDLTAWRDWLGYSFDTALPLVDLMPNREGFLAEQFASNQAGAQIPPGLQAAFAAERLLGLVIISFAIAGLTGWAERRGSS